MFLNISQNSQKEFSSSMVYNYYPQSSEYLEFQKQPLRCVLRKSCSENMQQIYRGAPMPKYNFNKVALQLCWNTLRHGCSLVNLLHIFRAPFLKNISEGLLTEFETVKGIDNHEKAFQNLRNSQKIWDERCLS